MNRLSKLIVAGGRGQTEPPEMITEKTGRGRFLTRQDGVRVGKRCSDCGTVKHYDDFGKVSKGIDGKSSQCKECKRKYDRNKRYIERKKRKRKISNKVEFREGYAVIFHKAMKYGITEIYVDIEDVSKINEHFQSVSIERENGKIRKIFGRLKGKSSKELRLSRFIMKPNTEESVYFKEGGKTDLRKRNMFKSSTSPFTLEGKECKNCGKWKERKEFTVRKGKGTARICKKCSVQEVKKWRESMGRGQIKSIRKVQRHRREARERLLPRTLTTEQLNEVENYFDGCALTQSKEANDLEHFIPLSTGHGGTTKGNCYPMTSTLNNSKRARNPFEWFEECKDMYGLDRSRFDNLVEYLAKQNDMTVAEYRDFVNWCFDNPRTVDDMRTDKRTSVELYREAKRQESAVTI